MARWLWIVGLVLALPAHGAVERIEITGRAPFADGAAFGDVGAYEKITGRLHYAIDPAHPANAAVVDLDLARRDGDGLVRFAGDFVLLRPTGPGRGNRRLLYEVGNRGGLGMVTFFNDAPRSNDPATRADAGNGFLFRQGYTLLWSAWNWDVLPGDGRLQIEVPRAWRDGQPLRGRIAAEITVDQPSASQPVAWGNSRGYPPAAPDGDDAVLTVRPEQGAPRQAIARDRWRFTVAENGAPHVALDGGFKPGLLYEVVYTATDGRVVGLGLTAIRDALSYFRFADADAGNPVAGGTDTAIAFGISQSGRVIQHMLYQAFHLDESARMVFDAALIHVAGAGKGSFNHRFAQTTRHPSEHQDHQYPADFFPFATVPQSDPLTGATGDVLARAKAANAVPLLFYTGSSTEYWTRAASLLHASVTGEMDLALDPHARLYVLAGAQHGNWVFPHRYIYENCVNPFDQRPVIRALLTRLDEWAGAGVPPPDSRYPRRADGTLDTVDAWRKAFPLIPELRLPDRNLAPPRLDLGPRWDRGIIDRAPPGFGAPFVTLVMMPDADGNDRGGIRAPEMVAPLGTHLGWNLRRARFGASTHIGRWSGSFIPFAADEATRAKAHDPRPSVAIRYGSKEGYLARFTAAAQALNDDGLLLDEDLLRLTRRAGAFYDRLSVRDSDSQPCAYLMPDSWLN